MPVRTRIVNGPVRSAVPPVGVIRAWILAGVKTMLGRIHQPSEGPLAGNAPIRRKREVLVLVTGIFAERPLAERGTNQHGSRQPADQRKTQTDKVAHQCGCFQDATFSTLGTFPRR